MRIKVMGTGCAKCDKLEGLVREVILELGVDAQIEKVDDIKEIVKAGVMITPGLVINDKVKFSGKMPTKSEVIQAVTTVLAEQ